MNIADLSQIQQIADFIEQYWWLVILVSVWSLIWKGLALWKSARNGSRPWFVILLLVNTVGILEIIYIYAINKKKN